MIEIAKKHLRLVLKINGANRNCKYYPCHYNGQVCMWCYCPFYPCYDERLGESIKRKDNSEIWSCVNCHWIHRYDVSCEVLKEILEKTRYLSIDEAITYLDDEEIKKIKDKVMKKYPIMPNKEK